MKPCNFTWAWNNAEFRTDSRMHRALLAQMIRAWRKNGYSVQRSIVGRAHTFRVQVGALVAHSRMSS